MENPNSLEKQSEKILKPEQRSGDFEFQEKDFESLEIEKGKSEKEKISEGTVPKSTDQATVGAPGIDTKDSSLHQSIESILESDLEDLYFQMNEKEQKLFKEKGEQTTNEIIQLIQKAKTTFYKIFKLIKNWLKIIPGINKFFIEQEAKIKADKIISLSP